MNIKELRAKTGMTQTEFGKWLGIPMRTIQNWENGQRSAPEYVVKLIAFRIEHAETVSKETPKKLKFHRAIDLPEGRLAGYCPTCEGCVDFELTFLVKHRGQHCPWCGQKIDLSGVESYE